MAVYLPSIGYVEAEPEIVRSESSARSGGRVSNVIEYADPMWVVSIETQPLYLDEFRDFSAWRDSLRGALRSVIFAYPGYHAPRAHQKGSPEATQAGTIASVTNGNVLNITGVHANLTLRRGDFLTIEAGGLRGLGRVIGSSGSGTSRAVEIEPRFPPHIGQSGATARFDRCELIMRQVPGSWSASRNGIHRSASFQLMESRV